MDTIPLTRLSLGAEELELISEVLASGMLVQGERVRAFEEAARQRIGSPFAVAVGSGTDAVHLACRALGVGPGDEVVVPDFCFPSVAAAVIYTGATRVLCDVDPETFNLDLQRIEPVLTDRTRAVVAVHQFGLPCGAAELDNELPCHVVEDAACAFGAIDDGGLRCGTQTVIGCFSMHPRKVITTAEGGLLTTDRIDLAERCRWLRAHGMRRTAEGLVFEEVGFAARMSEVHAAIGLAQLRRLDPIIEGRARSAAHYREALAGVGGVRCADATWTEGRVYQSLVVRVREGVDRDAVLEGLRSRGIECTIGTYAIHRQPAFRGRCRFDVDQLTGSISAADYSVTLPLWPDMPTEAIDRVTRALDDLTKMEG